MEFMEYVEITVEWKIISIASPLWDYRKRIEPRPYKLIEINIVETLFRQHT